MGLAQVLERGRRITVGLGPPRLFEGQYALAPLGRGAVDQLAAAEFVVGYAGVKPQARLGLQVKQGPCHPFAGRAQAVGAAREVERAVTVAFIERPRQ